MLDFSRRKNFSIPWAGRAILKVRTSLLSIDPRKDGKSGSPGLAAELTKLNVEIIVAPGLAAGLAAKKTTKVIPLLRVWL